MYDKKTRLTIRIDPMEKIRIKRWAHEAGQSLSDYIIEAVRERLAKDEKPLDEQSSLDLVQAELRRAKPIELSESSNTDIDEKSLSDLIKDYVKEDDTLA